MRSSAWSSTSTTRSAHARAAWPEPGETAVSDAPAAASGPGVDRAAVDLDPLAHANAGRAPAVGRRPRRPRRRRPRRRRRRPRNADPGVASCAGVLEHVRQGLLDDAGRRSARCRRGSARALAGDLERAQAGPRRGPARELLDLGRPGCGASSGPPSSSRSTPSSRRISASAGARCATMVASPSRPARDASPGEAAPSASAIITDQFVRDDVVHLARDPRRSAAAASWPC